MRGNKAVLLVRSRLFRVPRRYVTDLSSWNLRLSRKTKEFVVFVRSSIPDQCVSFCALPITVIQGTRTRRRCTQGIGLQRGTSQSKHSFASFHFFHSHFLPARFLPPNRRPFSRPDSLRFALFPCSSPVPIHGSSISDSHPPPSYPLSQSLATFTRSLSSLRNRC